MAVPSLRTWHAILLAFSYVFLLTSNTDRSCMAQADDDELSRELIEWIRANGGVISHKVEIRNEIPGDPTTVRGLFASEALDEGELVSSIPWDLIIRTPDPHDRGECGTVWATYQAMKDNSTPYAKYLNAQPRGYLPGFWSAEGQALLTEMLGELPPDDLHEVLVDHDQGKSCERNLDDPLEFHARMLVTARSDWQQMVPFYDMINHRNGKWYNINHRVDYGNRLDVVTTKKVAAGEQLHNSYNQCNICGARKDWFGTPEMFKFYGFVELMPQRWVFENVRVQFDLDWKEDDSGELQVKFLVPPSERGMTFFREELKRLQNFGERKKSETSVPKKEWDAIWQYHQALMVALTHALDGAEEVTDEVWDMGEYWWEEVDSDDEEYDEEEESGFGTPREEEL